MYHIRKASVIIFSMFLIENSYGNSVIPCPSELSKAQLNELFHKKKIHVQGKVFSLEGSTNTVILTDVTLKFEKFYMRPENNKQRCWYITNLGNIGIRQQ